VNAVRIADKIEDVSDLLDAGESAHAIAARLGTTTWALERFLYRHGRRDLGRPFARADWYERRRT
jgi:hypothetical protein